MAHVNALAGRPLGRLAGRPRSMRTHTLSPLIMLAACRLGDLVNTPVPPAALAVSPTHVDTSAMVGSTTPIERNLDLSAGKGDVTWEATEESPWLALSQMTGRAPGTIRVILDPTELNVGVHQETIVFGVTRPESDSTSDEIRVLVTLEITEAPPPPPPPPVSGSKSTVSASPGSIQTGQTSTITVIARDANANPVSGATVVLSVSPSANATLTQSSGKTNASGVATGTLSSTDAGEKTVSATIDDIAVSQTVKVVVTEPPPPPPPNQPPVVDAGPDKTILALFFTLDASFSDPDDNGPWSYTINWGDGSSNTYDTPSEGSLSRTHTYLLPGTYHVRVTVVDRDGGTGSDEMVLKVALQ